METLVSKAEMQRSAKGDIADLGTIYDEKNDAFKSYSIFKSKIEGKLAHTTPINNTEIKQVQDGFLNTDYSNCGVTAGAKVWLIFVLHFFNNITGKYNNIRW